MIKNLIFDCGGVVLEVDYALSLTKFREFSDKPELFDSVTANHFKAIASDFETGRKSIEEFYSDIRYKYKLNATDIQIKDAWNAMLVSYISESLDIIRKLKEIFTVSLFTNTNELHYIEFAPRCKELLSTFDNCFYSFQMGLRKPDKASFEYIINKSGYIPSETMFIDDSLDNVNTASEVGIIPFHYTKEWNLTKLYSYLTEQQ
ncbi:MAG: hypothetical protein A2X64_06180 [Ignavibacteria bacterium GWF2_33_9]|nr:MAG: hypothetical protein A2X64_06180 [Ignavibacteria bacterium GWF2_33_9]